ncbi:DUF1579 domain-containing protein [Cryptosporangium phraense]|uniref:DUF1579 domain-containing protein n=1 Tax=Cryptosporangium phraense TaxID=2593070 RepID=A0A545AJE0_9ACTN|nr:DUF1579 domain-containing protein [Cryptosporangium phraense]TQS41370.1 DUF1579 domain-containing protein [Cryptosporangium phraense]
MSSLDFLVGTFIGAEQVHPSPWTGRHDAEGEVTGVAELAGAIVVQRQVQRRDGEVTFEAVNVFQLDPATGATLLYSFDSVGYPPDPCSRGTWEDGTLVLHRATARGEARTTYTPSSDGYAWTKDFRAPGATDWSPVISGRLTTAF